jgi:hypothetical protein
MSAIRSSQGTQTPRSPLSPEAHLLNPPPTESLCEVHIYNSALLLTFENGIQLPPTHECHMHAASSLSTILGTITAMIESFITSLGSLGSCFETTRLGRMFLPPPFAGFLAYKSAALLMLRLNSPEQDYPENIRKLRVLRQFLVMLDGSWMNGRKYLEMLDEDTTPRTMKALKAMKTA